MKKLEVIKRDGSREPFDADKLKSSIQRASESVGMDQERIDDLYDRSLKDLNFHFKDVSEISSLEIEERVLEFLDMEEPSVSDVWRNFKNKDNYLDNI